MRICAVSYPNIKTVNLRCFVFIGSIYERHENNGISHFLEHMMFRGNEKLGNATRLNRKMEEMGGELNAVTSFDLTELWLDYHLDFLHQGIRRFCRFLQYPLFEQIEIERSIILEEIRTDYNNENQMIDLDGLTAGELWPKHPIGLPVVGDMESMARISHSDLAAWYGKFYRPGNMIIGINGDFDPSRVIELISNEFEQSHLSHKKSYSPVRSAQQIGRQIRLIYDKDNQFNLQWAFPTYSLTSDLRIEYQLIRRILDDGSSSRLQRSIREEKGLVYDISAEMSYFQSGAVFTIQCLVGTNRLEELISALTRLIEVLTDTGISQDELDLAKLRYRISLDCNNDTAQGVLFEAIGPLIYPGVGPFDETLSKMETISLERINRSIMNLFRQNRTCFALVGPWTEQNRQFLEQKLAPWINSEK